jgi:hypothetical protein
LHFQGSGVKKLEEKVKREGGVSEELEVRREK